MKIAASELEPGDLIRSIGMTVRTVIRQGTGDVLVGGTYGDGSVREYALSLPPGQLVMVRRLFRPGGQVSVPTRYIVPGDTDGGFDVATVAQVDQDNRVLVLTTGHSVPFKYARHA